MFQKIAGLLMSMCLLCGCAKGTADQTVSSSAKSEAEQIISALSLSDLKEVKKRMVIGAFFNEDEDVCSDAAVFSTEEESNTDAVGVFYTDDVDTCLSDIRSYLSSVKKESQYAYPSEVFKVSNAVLESNDHKVVMIIYEDIEDARKQARAVLNE
jgi:hypothetical protein